MNIPDAEAIEAAARALYVSEWGANANWEINKADDKAYWRMQARAALSAAAPFIAAQAKDEALAEVAEWEAEADTSIRCAANLRNFVGPNARKRLDQQEADRYEHHATIALNLAARMRETIEGKSE